jgi:hypothetical protein
LDKEIKITILTSLVKAHHFESKIFLEQPVRRS